MPRTARQVSITHTYHVMLRGNEKKKIFIDAQDKSVFTNILYNKKKDNDFCLYAYCIMDNHVHLVIKELETSISRIMKRIGTSYAIYFNKKYNRVGHVFQDRYKSEVIEDDRYLLSVIRYVHNNPVKAGICKVQEYRWSSYRFYIQAAREQKKLLAYEEILDYFSEDKDRAIALFKEFSNQEDNDDFLDMEDDMLDKEKAREYVKSYLEKNNIMIKYLKLREYRQERDILIKELIGKSQLSFREIGDLLGISRETVRRISIS